MEVSVELVPVFDLNLPTRPERPQYDYESTATEERELPAPKRELTRGGQES